MSIGHLRASRLDHDSAPPSKDPVGLALGSGRTWEGKMTRSQHARYPKKEITHTFGVIMSGAFVHFILMTIWGGGIIVYILQVRKWKLNFLADPRPPSSHK